MKFDPAKEISDKEALKLIEEIVQYGIVRLTDHVKVQMKKRGYSSQDIEYILTTGRITAKNFNEDFQNWEYRIEGADLDGDDGAVITAIMTRGRIHIITVLS